jgi:RNA polymerase sigma factor (sigma-70 family)
MPNTPEAPDPFVAQVVAQHGEDLLRFLSRRVRAADAHDLAQEVYVRLLRLKRDNFILNPEAYLYRVACNLLYEFEMNRRAAVDGLRRWSEEVATETQFATDSSANDMAMAARLRDTLNELPELQRAVLILHRQDGLTYDEIARKLAISPSTVKKYLGLGLRHCRARLRNLER